MHRDRVTPTQRQRIERLLIRDRRLRPQDVEQHPTIDGYPPIRRVPSRIAEIRATPGWKIDSRERHQGVVVYKLIAAPNHGDVSAVATRQPALALLDVPAEVPRPSGPYEYEYEVES